MAYVIHWKIKFRVLHSNQLLTVNVWKDGALPTGYPLTLTGAQAPFSTHEDDNEELFQPIRTQSGYLRIVDDGTAVNAGGTVVSFNWKDLLPSTDTDRPVTLTDASNNVLWQGFMQAQNFSGSLYGGTQVREFPVQCSLTVTQGKDINYQHTEIENFAYLLKQVVDSIPSGFRPQNFIIQGGTDAQEWLMKKIDWQNFATIDSDGALAARYQTYQCLEDMCRFWGWTARTMGDTMYLMCIDDQGEQSLLNLTYAQLGTLAGGTNAGTTSTLPAVTPSGDIFASMNIDDFMNRGANKAVVTVDGNTVNEVTEFAPDTIQDTWGDDQWDDREYYGDTVVYFRDITSFPDTTRKSPLLSGTAAANQGGSFAKISIGTMASGDPNDNFQYGLRFTKTYNGNTMLSLQTTYQHGFYVSDTFGGFLSIHGTIYSAGEKYTNVSDWWGMGNCHMYMRIGIGPSRATAKWMKIQGRTVSWVNTETVVKLNVAGNDDTIGYLYSSDNIHMAFKNFQTANLYGYVFIDFLGSDDLPERLDDDQCIFYIDNFRIDYTPNYKGIAERDECTYKADNQNNVREEWNADCIYGSMNNLAYGYGCIMNEDFSRMGKLTYGLNQEYAEQHLANRVVNFWATAKRMIRADLWNNDSVIGAITPKHYVTLDGTRLHPIAISHEWRDNVVTLALLEIPLEL